MKNIDDINKNINDINKNINLYEILKGHEGETFYSPVFGIVILQEILNDYLRIKSVDKVINLYKDGKYDIHGECMIFPAKDKRDWNRWYKENNLKVLKTWSDLERLDKITEYRAEIVRTFNNRWWDSTKGKTSIEKSALALLKIHQLIEVGYGGNVTNDEWLDRYTNNTVKYVIISNDDNGNFLVIKTQNNHMRTNPAFHTKKQAEEFLKYPENIKLLKDYFMLND